MDLRIKHIPNIGYFGQAKTGFFFRWETIGKHVHGYGLYWEGNINNPLKTREEALELCKLYEQWAYHAKQSPTYFEI